MVHGVKFDRTVQGNTPIEYGDGERSDVYDTGERGLVKVVLVE